MYSGVYQVGLGFQIWLRTNYPEVSLWPDVYLLVHVNHSFTWVRSRLWSRSKPLLVVEKCTELRLPQCCSFTWLAHSRSLGGFLSQSMMILLLEICFLIVLTDSVTLSRVKSLSANQWNLRKMHIYHQQDLQRWVL